MTTFAPALDDSFAAAFDELGIDFAPNRVPTPSVVALNQGLAAEIGIDPDALASPEGLAVLAGNAVPHGARPIAMGYAGHQFGGYSPRLGDGRAVLLGELVGPDGVRRDIHLKGSGRTPFSRGGDGKATLGPMLREFVMAEAMHALGISTARALAVVTTGEQVRRDGPEMGAVLTRVAASHIRVGTFEYAARMDSPDLVPRLVDYAIARHYPALADLGAGRHLAFLRAVIDAQAKLVASWMHVGFIHGVMNTDNVAISGETIDYGPCAFMDRYDPATVYSSIDHTGRYAYGNQPSITQWNLARLAETLIPLIDDDVDVAIATATEALSEFPQSYERYWRAGMAAKLGLADASEADDALFSDFLVQLHAARADYTQAFRSLSALVRDPDAEDDFSDGWVAHWRARLDAEGRDREVVAAQMDAVNPIYLPRNHLVDQALTAATEGDTAPFHQLLAAVTDPYDERPGHERYAEPAPDGFDDGFQTFCGT